MAVEPHFEDLKSDAAATGGGSLPEKKEGAWISFRVLLLPFVKVHVDEAVAATFGVLDGKAVNIGQALMLMEAQWLKAQAQCLESEANTEAEK
jgi:hypothetical protein